MIRLSFILAVFLSATVTLADGPAHRFRPLRPAVPTEDIASAGQLLAGGQFIRAMEKLHPFLSDPAEPLVRTDDDGTMSILAWIEALPPEQRTGLTEAWRTRFDPAARNALADLRKKSDAAPREYHALARRYALSRIAAEALALAGQRSATFGDAQSATAFYALAADAGWIADAGHAATIDACRAILARLADPAGYRGPMTYDATWFNQPGHAHVARYSPYAHDDIIYIAASRHLLAMRETGQTIWQWSSADAWSPAFTPDKAAMTGYGAGYAPAVFASPAAPQVLVVRQPSAGGQSFGLRAFRASDGRLLWRTDGQPAYERLSIASAPAIAGRYIYAAAVQFAEDSAALTLVAIDLLDGSLVFTCPLGSMLDMRQGRLMARQWDGFWEQSEPAVAGDCVYLTPNVGVAFCVDRFAGRIRWARGYDPAQRGFANRTGREGAALDAGPAPMPMDERQLLCYRTTPQTCGQTLVIAPQDSSAAIGLDARTGRFQWHQPDPLGHTLIAATADRAIFAGETVAAIDPATGQVAWRFDPPAAISGPPALVGGVLFVPTADAKIHALNPQTGQPASAAPRHPNFRLLAHSANGRKTLAEAMVLQTIGLPRR